MKVFIWDYVDVLTNRYHSYGGALVIASSLERAHEMLRAERQVAAESDIYKTEPTLILDTFDTEERVFVFPDAGCC